MRAAVKVARERFEIAEVTTPEIKDTECLVRVGHCGVCVWCYEEWLRDGSDNPWGPGVTGHEVSGVIEQVGPGVVSWKRGDHVLVYCGGFCGVCPECKSGKETYCRTAYTIVGGYAEFVAVPESSLLAPPRGIPLGTACLMTDMVGTPMHALRRAFSVDLDRSVVAVWGLGPVGLFTAQGLQTFDGVDRIIAIDPVKYRRDVALNLGADLALDPFDENTEIGLCEKNHGRGVNFAFNCALRSPEAIDVAYRTIILGGYLMSLTGSATSASQCEKRIDGSYYFFRSEYEENVALVHDGKIKLEPVLTHEFSLEQINEAMELRSRHPDKALKIIIRV